MKRLHLPVTVLCVASLLALGAAPAHACKCAQVPYDKVVAQTPVVFDGEVVRSEVDTAGLRRVTSLRVMGVVKGLPQKMVMTLRSVLKRTPQLSVTVISSADDAACGYDFTQGPQRLIVGADRDPEGTLTVNSCTLHNLNTSP